MATNELLYWYELNVQDVLGCIGGVQALFPILETVAQRECINLLSTMENPSSPATVEKPEMDGWEVLPSSSYAGLSIIRSGFFFLYLNISFHYWLIFLFFCWSWFWNPIRYNWWLWYIDYYSIFEMKVVLNAMYIGGNLIIVIAY